MTTFLTKFTAEFPIADGRLLPYLSGGGRVTKRYSVFPIPVIPFGDFRVFPRPAAYLELGLALVLGGWVQRVTLGGLLVGRQPARQVEARLR